MNATDRFAADPDQDRPTGQPGEERTTVHRPATSRKTRRFEIGFFIRKIVNGWVVFYRQFPPGDRAAVHARQRGYVVQESSPAESPERPVMAMAHAGHKDAGGGEMTTKSGTSPGSGDSGPVGSTSYEIGVFASVTETSDDET